MVQESEGGSKSSLKSETNLKHVGEIKESIKVLEKELEVLQNSCVHKEYEVKNCQSENRSFSLRKVCKDCSKEIGYPSQEEIDLWSVSH